MKFYNREKEIEWFRKHFAAEPNGILLVHGPRQSGKSSLVRQVLEHHLEKERFWVIYLDLKTVQFASYSNLLEAFFEKLAGFELQDIPPRKIGQTDFLRILFSNDEGKTYEPFPGEIIVEALREREARQIRPIIVLDEVQVLTQIYEGENKIGIVGLIHFLSYLSKTLHLAHCVLLANEAFFLNKLHNDASLNFSSDYFLIDHLDKSTGFEWLQEYFSPEESNWLWSRLGGNPSALTEAIRVRLKGQNVQAYLDYLDAECDTILRQFYYWQLENKAQRIAFQTFAKICDERQRILLWNPENDFLRLPECRETSVKICESELGYYYMEKGEFRAINETMRLAFARFLSNMNETEKQIA